MATIAAAAGNACARAARDHVPAGVAEAMKASWQAAGSPGALRQVRAPAGVEAGRFA